MKLAIALLLASALVLTSAEFIFPGLRLPATEADKHAALSVNSVVVGPAKIPAQSAFEVSGVYQLISRTNVRYGKSALNLGQPHDMWGNAINKLQSLGGGLYTSLTGQPESSNAPDMGSLIPINSTHAYMLIHFESPAPGSMYGILLKQDAKTGKLSVVSTSPVDFAEWKGLANPCAGSRTPWNSHLAGEETEPDARAWFANTAGFSASLSGSYAGFARYFGIVNQTSAPMDATTYWNRLSAAFNPYWYGHVAEAKVDPRTLKTSTTKWLTLARAPWETAIVLPDNKTVYLTEDGTNNGFYKFVADRASDLSAGTLYGAKFTQTNAVGGGAFDVTWIEMAHATQAELLILLKNGPASGTVNQYKNGLSFFDIFEWAAATGSPSTTCPEGFKYVLTKSTTGECLKFKVGMEKAAAFFETRRYIAYLGGTTELRKAEHTTHDPIRNRLYLAISDLSNGMLAEANRPDDHMKLAAANGCGCIFALNLDASFSATSMFSLTCGVPTNPQIIPGNSCSVDNIAGPDNLVYVPGQDALMIYEDTGSHENGMLWMLNLETLDLTRVASTPKGGEFTGGMYAKINGWEYITANVQHPNSGMFTGEAGYVGYLGPFQNLDKVALGLQHVPLVKDSVAKQFLVSSAKYNYGTRQNGIGFKSMARSGAKLANGAINGTGSVIFGEVRDQNGNAFLDYTTKEGKDYSVFGYNISDTTTISHNPDFTGLISCPNSNDVYAITHFEAPNPSAMYMNKMTQDASGILTVVNSQPVLFTEYGGLWTPCGGSMTPWGSRLGSEEYEPNARAIADLTAETNMTSWATTQGSYIIPFMRHFGKFMPLSAMDIKSTFNPYLYGYPTEVTIDCKGGYSARKLYTLGRAALELSLVMADNKTAYSTDDGTNVGFYKFVADSAGDLTKGTLYAAKLNQVSSGYGGSFDIEWIRMAWGEQEELRALATVTTFYDIFDVATPISTTGTDGVTYSCPAGFRGVNTATGNECLKLRAGMSAPASFLETRRYAAYLGATTEGSKWEGITLDPKGMKLYTAWSQVRYGMEDKKKANVASVAYDSNGPNHVRVEYNPCGCVMEISLDANYSGTFMKATVCGTPDTTVALNGCNVDGIAEPDNVLFLPNHRTLLIYEDTVGLHQNDAIWAFDIDTRVLTRIMTNPYGAELTSAWFYPELRNGYTYITAVVQHPYGETDQTKLYEVGNSGNSGTVGYLGPFEL